MKEFVNLENLSHEEWLEVRKGGIGGSDVGTILGYNKYKSNVELWKEKTGIKIKEFKGNAATERGHQAEQPIIDLWKAFNPQVEEVIVPKWMYQHDEHEFMRANFDGIAIVNGERCILEIKTAEPQNMDEWRDQIPQTYYCQVLHYLAISGYKRAYLVAAIKLRMSEDIIIKNYTINRNEDDINYIINAELEFYKAIQEKKEPYLIKRMNI